MVARSRRNVHGRRVLARPAGSGRAPVCDGALVWSLNCRLRVKDDRQPEDRRESFSLSQWSTVPPPYGMVKITEVPVDRAGGHRRTTGTPGHRAEHGLQAAPHRTMLWPVPPPQSDLRP